jgi:hypothetical protein
MNEHPILFSGDMARAILEGRKTQTRRVLKLPNWSPLGYDWGDVEFDEMGRPMIDCEDSGCLAEIRCPYGDIGDYLWVRETFGIITQPLDGKKTVIYRASHENEFPKEEQGFDGGKWRPSIFMPRWASRINLEVIGVDVQRVQDISKKDAIAEGMMYHDNGVNQWGNPKPAWSWDKKYLNNPDDCLDTAALAFGNLWDNLNAKRGYSWEANPWCWTLEFKRIEEVEK